MMVLKREEGQSLQILSDRVCIKLKSTNSLSSVAVVTVDVTPNGFIPPHTHTREEESYYMLKGSIDISKNDLF